MFKISGDGSVDPLFVRESTRQRLGLLTPEELAVTLEVTVNTLETWRGSGKGPAWVKLGKGVFYRHEDVVAWIRGSRVEPGDNVVEFHPETVS